MTSYICMRCNKYDTKIFYDMKKHCLRRNPCKKRSDIILFSDDQLLISTLLPYYNGIHTASIDEIKSISSINIISKNKDKLFTELDVVIKENIKICKYCDEEFETSYLLRRHLLLKCFYNNLFVKIDDDKICVKKNDELYLVDNSSNINNNYINCNNTTNVTNITNNSNYNFFLDLPVPFEDDWDLSKISKLDKSEIMVSQYVFSKLLSEILNNEKNSNVIIDKDKNSTTGMVYINHKRRYITMSKKDIVGRSMDKLYDNAFDIIDNNKDCTKIIKEMSKDYIHNKYNQYVNDVEHVDEVDDIITEIFDKNKNIAWNKYKQIMDKIKNNNNNECDTGKICSTAVVKDRTEYRNKTEIINKRTTIDNIIKKRDEDLYYFYDSDGNTKI